MEISESSIPGCLLLKPLMYHDERGRFVKTFHEPTFLNNQLETNFKEDYYSTSRYGVLRGLHFQIPPFEHTKLVYCLYGEVLDVVVDLRRGSPSYGKYEMFHLDGDNIQMVYIPPGIAHGFYTLSEVATIMYKVTSIYHPESDCGVKWDSVGIPWPSGFPIVSERDNHFTGLSHYESPFTYSEKRV